MTWFFCASNMSRSGMGPCQPATTNSMNLERESGQCGHTPQFPRSLPHNVDLGWLGWIHSCSKMPSTGARNFPLYGAPLHVLTGGYSLVALSSLHPFPPPPLRGPSWQKGAPPSSCPSCYRCGGTTCSGIGNQSPSSHWLAWMDAVWMNDLFWGTDRREGQCGCLRRREESSSWTWETAKLYPNCGTVVLTLGLSLSLSSPAPPYKMQKGSTRPYVWENQVQVSYTCSSWGTFPRTHTLTHTHSLPLFFYFYLFFYLSLSISSPPHPNEHNPSIFFLSPWAKKQKKYKNKGTLNPK